MLIRIIGKFRGVRLYRIWESRESLGAQTIRFASRVARTKEWVVDGLTGAKCMHSDHLDQDQCGCGSQYQWRFLGLESDACYKLYSMLKWKKMHQRPNHKRTISQTSVTYLYSRQPQR